MTDMPIQEPGGQRPEGRRPGSRVRRAASATALVTGGLLAGGVLATSLSAAAHAPGPSPDATTGTAECRPGGAELDEETRAGIDEAVAADYPGATVLWARPLAGDGYRVHVRTVAGEHLVLTLDESFAVTDELTPDEMPGPGPAGFDHRPRHGDRILENEEEPTAAAQTGSRRI